MIKTFFIFLLLVNITNARVKVTSIANYMLNNTHNEGAAGPGFFINTQELTQVSVKMKKRLRINDLSKLTHSQNKTTLYTNKKIETNIYKKIYHKNQNFKEKSEYTKTNNQNITETKNKSFSEIITNHRIKNHQKQSKLAFK